MQQKFNEALVQQVREGKLAIENTDEAKTIALIAYIFPSDVSTLGLTNFYWASTPNCWTSDEYTSIPSRPVSDFFLQPLTEKEGKERTYRVTREQLKELYRYLTPRSNHSIAVETFLEKYFPIWDNSISITEPLLKSLYDICDRSAEKIKELFPDYSPTPHIPKGEFAWVSNDGKMWHCYMSKGDGNFYKGQAEDIPWHEYKHVRKYEDRPF